MLLFVGFIETERGLLESAAGKLGVLERCSFMSNVEPILALALNENPSNRVAYPAVIFLNLDGIDWKPLIAALKAHHLLNRVPVVGLGRLPDQRSIDALYGLGANSYIVKPPTFGEMMKAANVTLEYWLETTQLPNRHMSDL